MIPSPFIMLHGIVIMNHRCKNDTDVPELMTGKPHVELSRKIAFGKSKRIDTRTKDVKGSHDQKLVAKNDHVGTRDPVFPY